ncbi:MAG: helicase-exonuclease AddAB subunit AddA [Clostridium sp.]|jgi:ATP-dependent helicase/nuclease subunit A|nr:helicase-exonuclease AddAB subunit AddA [Clostridium sp.]
MAMKYTPQQQNAIRLRNRDILVSAAAGSGKTAVLVERILNMVCDPDQPVDIDRLLIVTFTHAAAAQLRERIRLGIADRLLLRPDDEHVQKQSTLLYNAQITTIDSFCLFLIRNHFQEIGLDPAFRVADEGEIKLLRQDVLQDMLEEKFAQKDPAFLHCVEYFCPGGKERVLERCILDLYEYAQSYPWPEEWLNLRKQDYTDPPIEETPYGKYLANHLRRMAAGCLENLEQIRRLCLEPDGPSLYAALVEEEIGQVEKLCRAKTLEQFGAGLSALSFGRLSSRKDETVSPVKRELAKTLRNGTKDTLRNLEELFFSTPLPLAAAQARQCAAPAGTLLELALEFGRRLGEKKRERKLIDFFDMEHAALDILVKREGTGGDASPRAGEVTQEYRRHYHEILIDEYQDSNLVQEYLLKAVSGEEDGHCNRFMVGDVKQSIYRFRLARPELFLEKYDTYTQEESGRQRIDLSRNFRSRAEVIRTVNGVFSRLMSRETGGIAYDDQAMLYEGASYADPAGGEDLYASELLLVEKPEGEEKLNARQAEALAVARKIKELRGVLQVTDEETGRLRPLCFRDVVILLRASRGWDEEFQKVLEGEGIPVYVTSKTGYFAAAEVQEILQFLRILDNPRQDIPLYGVMKSIFGGFSEEEIARLRSRKKQGCLYEAVLAMAGRIPPARSGGDVGGCQPFARSGGDVGDCQPFAQSGGDVGELPLSGPADLLTVKCRDFLDKIRRYRACTVYMPIRELLQEIVRDHHYLHYVAALPAGSKRKGNVEMLFTKASDFGKSSYFGLFHFIRYMEQLEKYDVDCGEAETMDENADVVRIMSIHKSKGLEFPVCFVSGLSKRFNMQDAYQPLILDMDLGIGIDYVDTKRRIRNKTLRRGCLARKLREDSLAEELRILYVALTRAKEKLVMTAVLENAEEKWEAQKTLSSLAGAEAAFSFCKFMEAGSFLDFLFPVAASAAVRVCLVSAGESAAAHATEQAQLSERLKKLGNAQAYLDEEALRNLRQRFAYRYPYQALERLYTKTTVSELKAAAMTRKDEGAFHIFEEKEIVPYIPAFGAQLPEAGAGQGAEAGQGTAGEAAKAAVLRGNAFHKVMERLDFAECYREIFPELPPDPERFRKGLDPERLRQNLERILDREEQEGRLTKEYRRAAGLGQLLPLLSSGVCYRMWRAQENRELFREQPFVYSISAARLGTEFPPEEKVLIQGIIDAFFLEDGQLVLLDYKTDAVRSPEELWEKYAVQLQYYEEALCRLTGLPMKEKILYCAHLERAVSRM